MVPGRPAEGVRCPHQPSMGEQGDHRNSPKRVWKAPVGKVGGFSAWLPPDDPSGIEEDCCRYRLGVGRRRLRQRRLTSR